MKRFIPLVLFLLALGLRSINFSSTINYANDQGEFLLESAKILHGEPVKLIGIYVSSKPVEGKYFFIGSQFLYLLAFLQKVLDYDPLKITFAFAVINSLAVVGLYILTKRWFGEKTALISSLLYATNPFAINYSKIIWNPSVQPILVILMLAFLNFPSLAGVILGILICTEYSSLVLVPVMFYLCRRRALWFLAGIIIGSANMIIFDLRHELYNSTLLLKYFLRPSSSGLAPHHLLSVLPLFFIFGGYLLTKFLPRKFLAVSALIIIVSQLVLVSQSLFHQTEGFKMAKYLSYPDLVKTVNFIHEDDTESYNVAQIINGESRSNAMRYLLTYPYGLGHAPKNFDKYSQSDWLYVLHYANQDPTIGDLYELSSFSQSRTPVWIKPVNDYLYLTKLGKN